MELSGVFEQIAAVLAVCVVAGTLATLLRQPLIVGLLAAGIAVGPEVLGLVEASGEIELLAKIGISLLLFVVGLKLDVRLIRRLGPVALATGLGQIAFTSVIGFGLAIALGYEVVTGLYIAVALTFSSTIIIVKLLTDKRELEDLHGRIALGFLIVQDLAVVLAMIALSSFTGGRSIGLQFLEVAGKGVALLVGLALIGRYVVPKVTHLLARSAELLVLAAVGWAVVVAAVSVLLGFSEEVGAFLAGMSLASSHYREALTGRLSTLRDFLLVFFFIELGTMFELGQATAQLGAAMLFSVFVLVGNPLIVLAIMGAMGYRKRVAFKAGLTVAQISEFSLILVTLGVSLGHIGQDTVGLVTAVGLVTISVSTYLIYGSDALYERLEPLLRPFERRRIREPDLADHDPEPDAIVIGLGRLGRLAVEQLQQGGLEVLGVDFDPRSVQSGQWDIPVVYGDAEDPDLPDQLPLASRPWIVSSLRSLPANLALLESFRAYGYPGRVAVAADNEASAERLRAAGADLVVEPFVDAAGMLRERLCGPQWPS